jgi:hypothetical protein
VEAFKIPHNSRTICGKQSIRELPDGCGPVIELE